MKFQNIREEELKNKVAQDYFWMYDCSSIIGNIDFCVRMHVLQTDDDPQSEIASLLWAEAKVGSADLNLSLVQLILTIGKARTFDKYLPPAMLGAFDAEKIAFIPYNDIHEMFYLNDFNWHVTPSNQNTKEFKMLLQKTQSILENKSLCFHYISDHYDLKRFIKNNFIVGHFGITKTRIDKNNFIAIYNKWLNQVKPTIAVNWDVAKKSGIIDGDFYLADLLSQDNFTLKEKLFVLLKQNHYELDRKFDDAGMFITKRTDFNDKQIAHNQFWNKYERPPREAYWDYIIERRDLLVPQDVRERKGSFFTPQIWVELSQQYLSDVLGENWQDDYYIWDCAAGTGNLLNGLTNKYHIWASTIDKQDVEVMQDRISNGANLLPDQVFQFDFLNDDFNKLPKSLLDIMNSPSKQKKLVVYINPPYAEHGTASSKIGIGKAKSGVANTTKIYTEFSELVGTATRELFAQFFLRVYRDLPNAHLASFSTLKYVNSQNFIKFRDHFKAQFKKGFICNSKSFDNVKGNFPIGFLIWDLKNKINITKIKTKIADKNFNNQSKIFYASKKEEFISSWLRKFYDKHNEIIAYLILPGVDMQSQNGVYITSYPTQSDIIQHKNTPITPINVMIMSLYLAIRHCIKATWVNDRDQFLSPNNKWEKDTEFQNDCLAFTLFHSQNKITITKGTNHWIPFTENEVNAKQKFESNFMTNFIQGKEYEFDKKQSKRLSEPLSLYEKHVEFRNSPLIFSSEAVAVFDAGRELFTYYHQQPHCIVNASLYDIKAHFQGRNESNELNVNSSDEPYTQLLKILKEKLKILAEKIALKVYEYEFLK